MNQDHFFAIGRSHSVCEDYALSGTKEDLPFAIVSDGCSSSENTDFGSRFLVKSTEFFIYQQKNLDPKELFDQIFRKAFAYQKNIEGLNRYCLDATLLLAYVYEENVKVLASGDGVIAAKKKDGTLEITEISYKGGAPVYLNYFHEPERFEILKEAYDCTKFLKTQNFDSKGELILENKEISEEDFEIFEFPISEYDFVGIMTDGVTSFSQLVETETSKTTVGVPTFQVVQRLMAFKGTAGVFVQRRCQRFLKNCHKENISHYDDFSISVIGI